MTKTTTQLSPYLSVETIKKQSYVDRKIIDMIVLHDDAFTMLQIDILKRWLDIDYDIALRVDRNSGIYIYRDGYYYPSYFISILNSVCYKIDMSIPMMDQYMKAMMYIGADVMQMATKSLKDIMKPRDWFDIVEEEGYYIEDFSELMI